MDISTQMLDEIRGLLGREPRGLEDVPVTSSVGAPMVIRVASLVAEQPFPTMFWLIDRTINYRIDQDEAGGLIQRLQESVDEDPNLQSSMGSDHEAHINLRNSYISTIMEKRLRALGFFEVLQSRGIGGIADFTRIRCLHTWYAAHLVVPNTVGGLLDRHWAEDCT